MLKKGAKGDLVEMLQNFLNEKLKAGLTVDGQFGSNTDKAVRKFQQLKKIEADGVVGPQTAAAIGQAGGSKYSKLAAAFGKYVQEKDAGAKDPNPKPAKKDDDKDDKKPSSQDKNLVSKSDWNSWADASLKALGKISDNLTGVAGNLNQSRASVEKFMSSRKIASHLVPPLPDASAFSTAESAAKKFGAALKPADILKSPALLQEAIDALNAAIKSMSDFRAKVDGKGKSVDSLAIREKLLSGWPSPSDCKDHPSGGKTMKGGGDTLKSMTKELITALAKTNQSASIKIPDIDDAGVFATSIENLLKNSSELKKLTAAVAEKLLKTTKVPGLNQKDLADFIDGWIQKAGQVVIKDAAPKIAEGARDIDDFRSKLADELQKKLPLNDIVQVINHPEVQKAAKALGKAVEKGLPKIGTGMMNQLFGKKR